MGFGRFVLIVLAICAGGYAGLLALGRSPVYCRSSHVFSDTAPCFKPAVSGHRAEVLLVGDSSLLYSIRPDAVAAAGGGSSYNLGMVGPSFSFVATDLIDRYLARNDRPKAIILYFGANELISDRHIIDPQWAPAGIYLLQWGSAGDLLRLARARLSSLAELPPLVLNGIFAGGPRAVDYAGEMAVAQGWLHYGATSGRTLDATCRASRLRQPPLVAADNAQAVAALRARYAAQGIPLFVYVAPTAQCDATIEPIRAAYRGVADNVPEALPNALFADDTPFTQHVHPSDAGVAVFSQRLADFVRETVRPRMAAAAR